MNQVVIYPYENTIAVVIPCSTSGIPVHEIARKDVPAGVPFLIIDAAELPTDDTYRAAWTANFSTPDGVGIGADAWFAEQNGG